MGESGTALQKLQIKIGGMSCSFCAESIRKACSRLDGVERVNVSLSHEEALVQFDPAKVQPWQIEEALRSLGYTVRDPKKLRSFEEEQAELRREFKRLVFSGIITAIAASLMVLSWIGLPKLGLKAEDIQLMQSMMNIVMVYLAIVNVFIIGFPILRMAYHSVRREILNQHALLEFGAFGGIIGGSLGFYFPSFPVMDFFAVAVFITSYHILSGYASLRVRTHASQAVRKLLELQPATARVIRDGGETIVGIEEVKVGEFVRVRPGERIPVDGLVVDGYSTVDQSLVTGESIPVEKTVDTEVIGGSVNLTGTLKVKVSRVGEESFLQQVARYIEEARALKPGILQLVDMILKYYVPGVLTVAAVGFLIWTLGAWVFLGKPDLPRATFAALAALVMGYPCALGMATPLATIRGGGMAARKGILIRSSEAFHALKDLKVVVLDKTGTITKGEPRVARIEPLGMHRINEVLLIAGTLEQQSEHPLAKAIVARAKEAALELQESTDFAAVPGKGVRAVVNGKLAFAGTLPFLDENGVDINIAQPRAHEFAMAGLTVVAVSYDGQAIGLIGIADTIKEDAADAIARLKEAGLQPIMVTGDNERTALAVAEQVGIEQVIAEVLPNQKADQVRRLQEQGFKVAMVGDGINDAPALMQADVGIAIGAGTDIAIESADIVIVGKSLGAVVDAYHIGRSSYNKTKQNLALAFSFNGVGVPASVTGLVHPVWAMAAMISSVSLVLLNSFGGRLVPRRKEQRPIGRQLLTIKVPTIHCENCLSTLLDAITNIDEVQSAEGDETQKLLLVRYKGNGETEERIRRAIINLGHAVT
jgi:heavy metal translocating P-type ATPase